MCLGNLPCSACRLQSSEALAVSTVEIRISNGNKQIVDGRGMLTEIVRQLHSLMVVAQ